MRAESPGEYALWMAATIAAVLGAVTAVAFAVQGSDDMHLATLSAYEFTASGVAVIWWTALRTKKRR